mmetsp:Transcript_22652/g.31600  ORF Transcript_22652/g.31600 Transcript_22652/m.31600 type:complete len:618 (-) Transcript_22652:148-2001(-)
MRSTFHPRPLRSFLVQRSKFSCSQFPYFNSSNKLDVQYQFKKHRLTSYTTKAFEKSPVGILTHAIRQASVQGVHPFDYKHLQTIKQQPQELHKVIHMESLALTEEEIQIFRLLMEARNKSGSKTVLRAAGGWVRDKLLGLESDDIDLALDDELGRNFATKVHEYLVQEGESVSEVGVIQMNPDQSKHLETARLKVRGVWLDLVNLRAEAYAEDSRIPTTTEFGTPTQDAYRRDLTINSMFYNLNTGSIEDWTGMGLSDLRNKVIRTPLPPMDTFLDDPLRVLRAVRFSARFNFMLHPDLMEAAALENVRLALRDKVSKERVGTELDGMLKSRDPVAAMRNLLRMGIFEIVFQVPQGSTLPPGRHYAGPCVAAMKASHELIQELGPQFFTKQEVRMCLLASLLLPLQDCALTVKKKKVMVPGVIIKEEFKFNSKDADTVVALHSAARELVHVAAELGLEGVHPRPGVEPAQTRSEEAGGGGYPAHLCIATGLLIRKLKEAWRVVLPLVAIQDIPCVLNLLDDECNVNFDLEPKENTFEASRRASLTHQLVHMVEAMGLERAWEIKPLIDGNTMMKLMGLTKGGPKLGEYMDAQLRWQLQNPFSSVDECKERMLKLIDA